MVRDFITFKTFLFSRVITIIWIVGAVIIALAGPMGSFSGISFSFASEIVLQITMFVTNMSIGQLYRNNKSLYDLIVLLPKYLVIPITLFLIFLVEIVWRIICEFFIIQFKIYEELKLR